MASQSASRCWAWLIACLLILSGCHAYRHRRHGTTANVVPGGHLMISDANASNSTNKWIFASETPAGANSTAPSSNAIPPDLSLWRRQAESEEKVEMRLATAGQQLDQGIVPQQTESNQASLIQKARPQAKLKAPAASLGSVSTASQEVILARPKSALIHTSNETGRKSVPGLCKVAVACLLLAGGAEAYSMTRLPTVTVGYGPPPFAASGWVADIHSLYNSEYGNEGVAGPLAEKFWEDAGYYNVDKLGPRPEGNAKKRFWGGRGLYKVGDDEISEGMFAIEQDDNWEDKTAEYLTTFGQHSAMIGDEGGTNDKDMRLRYHSRAYEERETYDDEPIGTLKNGKSIDGSYTSIAGGEYHTTDFS